MNVGKHTNSIISDYLEATGKSNNSISVEEYILFRNLAEKEIRDGFNLDDINASCVSKHDTNVLLTEPVSKVTTRIDEKQVKAAENISNISKKQPKEVEEITTNIGFDEEEYDMLSLLRAVPG